MEDLLDKVNSERKEKYREKKLKMCCDEVNGEMKLLLKGLANEGQEKKKGKENTTKASEKETKELIVELNDAVLVCVSAAKEREEKEKYEKKVCFFLFLFFYFFFFFFIYFIFFFLLFVEDRGIEGGGCGEHGDGRPVERFGRGRKGKEEAEAEGDGWEDKP
jgi:ATP-dependent Zn protease